MRFIPLNHQSTPYESSLEIEQKHIEIPGYIKQIKDLGVWTEFFLLKLKQMIDYLFV